MRSKGGRKRDFFFLAHLELAVHLKHELAQRGRPARRGAIQHATTKGIAERGRTKCDVPEGLVCGRYLVLVLEEVGHPRVRREPEHVLRRVREGRRPEKLRQLCVERGEDVEEGEERLRIIEWERLCEIFFLVSSYAQQVQGERGFNHVWNGEVGVGGVGHAHRKIAHARMPFWWSFPEALMVMDLDAESTGTGRNVCIPFWGGHCPPLLARTP